MATMHPPRFVGGFFFFSLINIVCVTVLITFIFTVRQSSIMMKRYAFLASCTQTTQVSVYIFYYCCTIESVEQVGIRLDEDSLAAEVKYN